MLVETEAQGVEATGVAEIVRGEADTRIKVMTVVSARTSVLVEAVEAPEVRAAMERDPLAKPTRRI
jgi:hypothetical protein